MTRTHSAGVERVLRAVARRVLTSLEGSNRARASSAGRGRYRPGKVSNELVHEVDLVHDAGARRRGPAVPADRMIDGMDMRGFLLGDARGVRPRD